MGSKVERLCSSRAIAGAIRSRSFFNDLIANGVCKKIIDDEISGQIFDTISSAYVETKSSSLDFDVIKAKCVDNTRANATDFKNLVSMSFVEETIEDARKQQFETTKDHAMEIAIELKSAYTNRKIAETLKEASESAATSKNGVSLALKTLGNLQSSISREMGMKSKVTTIQEMKNKIISDITTEEDPPVTTGFPRLDEAFFGGFQNSYLVYICGRPGMAKTQVLINMMLRAADEGRRVLFMTYELPAPFIIKRILAYKTNMTLSQLIGGTRSKEKISKDDIDQLSETIDKLSKNIYVCDAAGMNIAESAAFVRSELETKGIEAAYFDYAQIIRTPDGKVPEKESDFSSISFTLRELAASCNIPVISAAQLNREVEKRKNKRPLLSDLRSSGSFENDARIVIGLYRDEYYNKHTEDQNILEMAVLKNTNGELVTTRNFFNKQKCTILELDENHSEDQQQWNNYYDNGNQEESPRDGSLYGGTENSSEGFAEL